ncbi:hypothetical protein C0213_07210 [Latilactobacillus sakei]|nr:hypothetical protein [Latilactobacillus sakei]AUX12215.1 hypothetical protein C0213_07210 [Latilactobacillus sakei]
MFRSRPAFLLVENIIALTLVLGASWLLTASLLRFKHQQTLKQQQVAQQAVLAMAAEQLRAHQQVKKQWQMGRTVYTVTANQQKLKVTTKAGESVAINWTTD